MSSLLECMPFRRTVAAAALAVGVLPLGGCIGWGWEPANFKASRTMSVDHVAGRAVDVQTENGAISVVRGSTSEVTIVANLKATSQERLDAALVTADRDANGTLLVRVLWPEKRKGAEGCSFQITLPDAVGLRLDTSNGEIKTAGLAGDAVLDTSNGAIRVTDHQGKVHADTSNGGIEVRSCTGGVHADTSNGEILLVEVGGPVVADTSNGEVTLVMRMDARGPIDLSSSNGGIDVALSPLFAGTLDADTSNGSVSCTNLVGATRTSVRRSSATIQFVPGVSPSSGVEAADRSRLDTSNGSITIKSRSGA